MHFLVALDQIVAIVVTRSRGKDHAPRTVCGLGVIKRKCNLSFSKVAARPLGIFQMSKSEPRP